jgi:hypothetical protein
VRRLVCILVGLAALAVPATASALGTSTTISGTAVASNGYAVTWYATTGHLGSTPVTLTIMFTKGGGTFGHANFWQQTQTFTFNLPANSLKFDKKLKKGTLTASLGTYGKVKLKFKGKGKKGTIIKRSKACDKGPSTLSRSLKVSGSITFSPKGVADILKVGKKGSASRATSNTPYHCVFGRGGGNCTLVNGAESFSSFSLGIGAPNFFANRAKAGGIVQEQISDSSPLLAPGISVSREIFANGPPGLLTESGTAPGMAMVQGAGHGIGGSQTLTNTLTSMAQTGVCAAFTSDSISGSSPGPLVGTITAAFDGAPAKLDATAEVLSAFWNRYHT